MVDSGCTRTIVHEGMCDKWFRKSVAMTQIGGTEWRCQGTSKVQVTVGGGVKVEVRANVSSVKPFGFECVLGMDAIKKLKGVNVVDETTVSFGEQSEVCAGMVGPGDRVQDGDELQVDERDFRARFDPVSKCWTMAWKWRDEREPEVLRNVRSEYAIPPEARQRYEEEVEEWVKCGWLRVYDEDKHGPAKGLIPLMAVIQPTKDKVRPVMDFREVNQYIDAYTGDADVCADKLREWRKMGPNVSVVDLAKAYLQVRVEEKLWPY